MRGNIATKADLLTLELRLTFRLGAITVATVAAMTAFITIILTIL